MQEVRIKIVNRSANDIPEYSTSGSAGLDIRANLNQPLYLKSLQREMVPTGLFIELPEGHEAQIRPRSGLATKYGITCLNTPGTIDSDYRGEVRVIRANLGGESLEVRRGERIAQLVPAPVLSAAFREVETLSESRRGAGGCGSTGRSI